MVPLLSGCSLNVLLDEAHEAENILVPRQGDFDAYPLSPLPAGEG